MSDEEKKRNVRGNDYLFVHSSHPTYQHFHEKIYSIQSTIQIDLPSEHNDGMSGKVWHDENYPANNSTFIRSPISYLCPDLQNNKVISVKFKDPEFDKSFVFKSVVLSGARMPEPTLKPSDWNNNQQYRSNTGFNRNDNYRQNNNSTVVNRMLQNSLNINDISNDDQTGCISSAYGGHNSSYYGSYRTNNNNNNNNNNFNRRNYDNNYQGNRFQQPQQYRNNQYGNNNYQQPRNQQYNNNNNNNNSYMPQNQQFNNNNNNNPRNFNPNYNPVNTYKYF